MAKRNAFTLIEMLIVIAIIVIMAMTAVWGFSAARQSAQIDVGIDSLVSAFKEQQSYARSGRVTEVDANGEAKAEQCYGIAMSVDEPYVQMVNAPYIAVNEQKTKADFCDMSQREVREASFFKGLLVTDIQKFDQTALQNLVVMFKPPFGRPVFGTLDSVEFPNVINNPLIKVEISLPRGEKTRVLQYNVASGLIERTNE